MGYCENTLTIATIRVLIHPPMTNVATKSYKRIKPLLVICFYDREGIRNGCINQGEA